MPAPAPRPADLVAEIIVGEYGLTADVNPLRIPPGALTRAEGVVLEGGAVEKEPGATLFDSVGGTPSATGTLTGAATWQARLATFKLTTGASAATVLGTQVGAAVTSLVITLTAAAGAGLRVVVALRYSAPAQPQSVVDSQGNTYALAGTKGSITAIYSTRVTTPLGIGDTITISFGANPATTAAATAVSFTNDDSALDRTAARSAGPPDTAVTVGPTPPLTYVPELIVYIAGWDAVVTHTAGSGFTEHNEHDQLQISSRVDTVSPTIAALLDYEPLQPTSYVAGGWTVSAVKGTTAVTSTGAPSFDTRLFLNDLLELTTGTITERRRVTAVTATTVTVADPWTTDFAGLTTFIGIAKQRIITATLDGKLYKEQNGNLDAVTLQSGRSLAHPAVLIQAGKEGGAASNRKLFALNGHDAVVWVDGDAATATALNGATEASADWTGTNQPMCGAVHGSRLWLAGNLNHGHRLYGSLRGNHRDFRTTTGSDRSIQLDVPSDVGERLVAMVDYNGALVLGKYPRGLFWLDDTDLDFTRWQVQTKSVGLGVAPSPYAMLATDDDVLLLTPDARFHLLSAVDTLSGLRASDLSAQLRLERWLRANIDVSRLEETVSVWYPQNRVALFGLPATGSPMNTVVCRFDFSGQFDPPRADGTPASRLPKFTYSYLFAPGALAARRDPTTGAERIMVGEAGSVFLLNQIGVDPDAAGPATGYEKSGNGYATTVRLPPSDLRFLDPRIATRQKNFKFVEMVFDETAGAEMLTVVPVIDGVTQGSFTTRANRKGGVDRFPVSGNGREIELRLTSPVSTLTYRWLAVRYIFELGDTEMRG